MGAMLSAEADAFLAAATANYNATLRALEARWNFSAYERWEFDPRSGQLQLRYADGSVVRASGQLLGTYCTADRTFEWAWNSPHFRRSPLADASRKVKAEGKRMGIDYLVAGMIPVPTEEALAFVCAIGLQVAEAEGVFRGSEGDVHPILLLADIERVTTG